MKTLTVYQCEVCNTTYDDIDEALACENAPINPPKYPIGTRFSDKNVGEKRIVYVANAEKKGHSYWYKFNESNDDYAGVLHESRVLEYFDLYTV